ncbi:PREDICTED: galactosylgalactosylxylosylprotein 3-beta-glucuronosyltransferase 3-like, partial [Rhagoletis zephyria]|uniref:galactosylgalactosylxylosylprotein 3-beta-glucuronosyltransferase 3-like n=1 Tax=Rhagoletis zephyria TaxID=28612 RepID=UPI00081143E3
SQKLLPSATIQLKTSPESDATIFFITPTYARQVQKAELTRLSHTLLLVENIHWIVVEDAPNRTSLVAKLLAEAKRRQVNRKFEFTHLNALTPNDFKTVDTDPNWLKPRGVWQRNRAIEWLREHFKDSANENGVVYFGDDDNTYDLKLFEEIRNTSRVSIFPVGLVGGLIVEKPLVANDKVIGFNSVWNPKRKYPIDMAGFAVNLQLLLKKEEASFSEQVPRGYQETHLISQLIDSLEALEPKGRQCKQVLVWHTRTEKPKLRHERKLKVPSTFGMIDD